MGVVGSRVAGREALGGDIKLCAVMGLYLGWQRFILAMLLASVVASVVLMILKRSRAGEDREYPFAPFLASGLMVAILCGDAVIGWYLSLLI